MPHSLVIAIGYLAGTLTTLSFVPQVRETLRCKSAHDLSYAWLLIFALGVLSWLLYGLFLHAWPIIVANAVTLGLVLVIIGLKVRYR